MGVFRLLIPCVCTALLLQAGESWRKKDYNRWSPADTQQVLYDSAWAKQCQGFIGTTDEDPHTYPVQGPSAHDIGLGGSDSKEWFPVGKIPTTKMPTLPVLVRWDSAQPVREALVRSQAPEAADTQRTFATPEKYYVIAVAGLATAHKSGNAEQDREEETRLRQGLLNEARLLVPGRHPIVPEDARVDQDTGLVRIYFPKEPPITLNEKEVTFGIVYGSVRVVQKFKLKDMVYKGELSL